MVRHTLTVAGILSIFGVFFFFIKPDWIKQISSNPVSSTGATTSVVYAKLSAQRLKVKQMPRDKGGLLEIDAAASGEDMCSKIVEDVGEDLPSRNAPYLLVINVSDHSMRYCRLSTNVRRATLRGDLPAEVQMQEVVNTPGGPYQVIIWIPNAIDVPLEFEVQGGAHNSILSRPLPKIEVAAEFPPIDPPAYGWRYVLLQQATPYAAHPCPAPGQAVYQPGKGDFGSPRDGRAGCGSEPDFGRGYQPRPEPDAFREEGTGSHPRPRSYRHVCEGR